MRAGTDISQLKISGNPFPLTDFDARVCRATAVPSSTIIGKGRLHSLPEDHLLFVLSLVKMGDDLLSGIDADDLIAGLAADAEDAAAEAADPATGEQ